MQYDHTELESISISIMDPTMLITSTLIASGRTGNVVLDIIIASIVTSSIPVVIKVLLKLYNGIDCMSSSCCRRKYTRRVMHERFLQYEPDGGLHSNTRNEVLLKMMRLYLSSLGSDDGHVRTRSMTMSLAAVLEKYTSEGWNRVRYGTTMEQIEAYHIIREPLSGQWAAVAGYKDTEVSFKHEVVTHGMGNTGVNALVDIITIRSNSGSECERVFADAMEHYKKTLRVQHGTTRWFYTLAPKNVCSLNLLKKEPQEEEKKPKYMAFPLDGEKTFDTIFFARKAELLQRLDDFSEKRGKYAIPGVKHQLGLLLHGPPGTGKTSVIRALAEKLGRHVVSVSLSQIKTNAELFELMMFPVFDDPVAGSIRYDFGDLVYILEDVDCACDVVESRDAKDVAEQKKNESSVNVVIATEKTHGDDALNLSGLLNVLEGVAAAHRRVFVLTTNFPDKLDAALKRRCELELLMSYLSGDDAIIMANLFFKGQINADHEKCIREVISKRSITPATLESLAFSAETPNELIELLSPT